MCHAVIQTELIASEQYCLVTNHVWMGKNHNDNQKILPYRAEAMIYKVVPYGANNSSVLWIILNPKKKREREIPPETSDIQWWAEKANTSRWSVHSASMSAWAREVASDHCLWVLDSWPMLGHMHTTDNGRIPVCPQMVWRKEFSSPKYLEKVLLRRRKWSSRG